MELPRRGVENKPCFFLGRGVYRLSRRLVHVLETSSLYEIGFLVDLMDLETSSDGLI